jgi:Mg2+ and Co2+ transporter CorA
MLQVVGIPLPLVILQNLHWIIASEWLCVTIYMERELNTIEWRLENEKTSLEGFEFYLEKLFTMRRRISKYKSLVDDHFQSCLSHTPKSWYTSGQTPPRPQGGIGSSFHEVYSSIQRDIEHVQSLIQRNADRITETVTLITSLMSVLEGKTALKQNQRLGLLTIFATLALPFNAAAAIFSVQTEFGPGGKQFGVFWEVAGSILGLAALLLALLYLVPWLIANRKAPIKGLRR